MSDGTRIRFADPHGQLMDEIANPAMRRKDVAMTMRLIIRSGDIDRVRWPEVNRAIVSRWSLGALDWIKKLAWQDGAP